MIRLTVRNIICDNKSNDAALLVLRDFSGDRELAISVRHSSAHDILSELETSQESFPNAISVFLEFIDKTSHRLEHICVDSFEHGVFCCSLSFVVDGGEELVIDNCPPHVAILLAMKCNAEIFCSEYVYEKASFKARPSSSGITILPLNNNVNDDIIEYESGIVEKLSLLPIEEINMRIEMALARDDYKYAARLRDARNKKNKKDNENI